MSISLDGEKAQNLNVKYPLLLLTVQVNAKTSF